ncbi:MAG: YbjN domain-containing protein [Deltaproteobacteria bacterium]
MADLNDIELIASFLKDLGIDPESVKKAPNIWSVSQNGSAIYIIVVKGFMILQSKIMSLPHSNISTFYRKLLELNDNVEESLGASFGINRNNEIILKMLRPTTNLTFNEFSYYLTSISHVTTQQTRELKERFND